jgi:hypothetical protein
VDAVPFASVTALVGETVADPDVTLNETVTPAIGASLALVTSNTSGDASVLPTVALCPAPLTLAIVAGVAVFGPVESLHAAATMAAIRLNIVLPPRAKVREFIPVSTFLGVVNNRCHFLEHPIVAIPYRPAVTPKAEEAGDERRKRDRGGGGAR